MTTEYPKLTNEHLFNPYLVAKGEEKPLCFTADMVAILNATFRHTTCNDFSVEAWEIHANLYLCDNEDGTFGLHERDGYQLMRDNNCHLWCALITFWEIGGGVQGLTDRCNTYVELLADGRSANFETVDGVLELYHAKA